MVRQRLVIGLLVSQISSLNAFAGSMYCGTQIITDDEMQGESTQSIREKCGAPDEKNGNNWVYKHSDGATYRLHFNDNGELGSIELVEKE
jgi:hypothetical protein